MGKNHQDRADRFSGFSVIDVVFGMTLLVGLIVGVMVMIPVLLNWLRQDGNFLPETALPVLLIAGTVLLMLAVGMIAVAFGKMNLASWKHPLGLPEGSIRAIIALLLILLFFITGVFLYGNVAQGGEVRVLEGVDAERLAAIPLDDIENQVVTSDGDDPVYRVTLRGMPDQDSVDIAKYLMTTVGTLVVSVAAFYFGSRSVEVASATARTVAVTGSTGGGGDHDGTPGAAGGIVPPGTGGSSGAAVTPPPPPPQQAPEVPDPGAGPAHPVPGPAGDALSPAPGRDLRWEAPAGS